eukprot:6462492-Amphidinium_carterae.4
MRGKEATIAEYAGWAHCSFLDPLKRMLGLLQDPGKLARIGICTDCSYVKGHGPDRPGERSIPWQKSMSLSVGNGMAQSNMKWLAQALGRSPRLCRVSWSKNLLQNGRFLYLVRVYSRGAIGWPLTTKGEVMRV